MFILMHLSPHIWYKIRKHKAKRREKNKIWSLGIRRAPQRYLELVTSMSHCQTVLGGRGQSTLCCIQEIQHPRGS